MKLCVYEGYLRNRKSLLHELRTEERPSRRETEENIILEAFRRWGTKCGRHLYGSFAFAVFNEDTGEYFCTRDAFGIRPFYYTFTNDGNLRFGTDIPSIVDTPSFSKEIDKEALQFYMMFGYPIGRKTLYRNVFRLLPGKYMVYRKPVLEEGTWFTPEFFPDDKVTEEEWTERISFTLDSILAEDLENNADRSRCSFLSGGVDSAFLLSLNGTEKAYGIGFAGSGSDETLYAEAAAEYLHRDFRKVTVTPEDYFGSIPRLVKQLGLPLADRSSPAFLTACVKTAGTGNIWFSGEGADEFFAGYHIYGRAAQLGQPGSDYFGCSGIMEQKAAAALLGQREMYDTKPLISGICGGTDSYDPLSRMLKTDISLFLEGDIFFGLTGCADACGTDILTPFADRRLFDIASKIPSSLKRKDGISKYIFRKAALDRLPQEIAFRKKAGFPVPFMEWIGSDPFRSELEAKLFGRVSEAFFDGSLLHQYWDALKDSGKSSLLCKIYAVFVFVIWYETCFERQT